MMWFDGTNLDTLGQVDLPAVARPPSRAVQLSVREAPGVSGAAVLAGGVRPWAVQVPVRLEGVGPTREAALLDLVQKWRLVQSWVGVRSEFVDALGEVHARTTLTSAQPLGPHRFSIRSGATVAAMPIVLDLLVASGE